MYLIWIQICESKLFMPSFQSWKSSTFLGMLYSAIWVHKEVFQGFQYTGQNAITSWKALALERYICRFQPPLWTGKGLGRVHPGVLDVFRCYICTKPPIQGLYGSLLTVLEAVVNQGLTGKCRRSPSELWKFPCFFITDQTAIPGSKYLVQEVNFAKLLVNKH